MADGIMLRTLRGGPHQDEPKLPPVVQSMIERGLVELRTASPSPQPSSRPQASPPCATSPRTAALSTGPATPTSAASWGWTRWKVIVPQGKRPA